MGIGWTRLPRRKRLRRVVTDVGQFTVDLCQSVVPTGVLCVSPCLCYDLCVETKLGTSFHTFVLHLTWDKLLEPKGASSLTGHRLVQETVRSDEGRGSFERLETRRGQDTRRTLVVACLYYDGRAVDSIRDLTVLVEKGERCLGRHWHKIRKVFLVPIRNLLSYLCPGGSERDGHPVS